MPLCDYATVRRVAHVAHEVLDELGATGFPKTSGGKGLHVYVRIVAGARFHGRAPRRAGVRAGGRAAWPDDVTTTWWRKDRDPAASSSTTTRTPATTRSRAAYSVRGIPEATVSTPIRWDEIDDAVPGDFTIATVPPRFAELGDLHADIDDAAYRLDPLLEWADRDERAGPRRPRLPPPPAQPWPPRQL